MIKTELLMDPSGSDHGSTHLSTSDYDVNQDAMQPGAGASVPHHIFMLCVRRWRSDSDTVRILGR